MNTGLSLENLARILHTDKQRQFGAEAFARQVELAQNHAAGSATRRFPRREALAGLALWSRLVMLISRPHRLHLRWLWR